jgi:hypothetical protein
LGALPSWIVIERKNLLNTLSPAAAPIVKDFERLADLLQAWIVVQAGGALSSGNAIENRCQVQELAAGFEKMAFQGLGGG